MRAAALSLKAGAPAHAAAIAQRVHDRMPQFGYDDVLGTRVLEEYESERARWARSAEKLRHETVAAILAGEPVDAQHAGGVLRYPLELYHVAMVLWSEASDDGLAAEDRLGA